MTSPQFQYRHTSLDQAQPDAFRLLTLIPGNDEEPVQCRLTIHRRHDAPLYRALSYTWGNEPPSQLVHVNRRKFLVTPNLHSALRNFRPEAGADTQLQSLWIDFICINQADTLERNNQVGQMQEIFAGAEEVLVWLGPPSPAISLGFVFVAELCRHLEELGIKTGDDIDIRDYRWPDFERGVEPFLGEEFQERWKAVAEIMLRPWWERAWIIQELASARTATLFCGKSHVPLDLLALVIRILYIHNPKLLNMGALKGLFGRDFGVINRAWALINLRYELRNHGTLGIYFVVEHSQRYYCRDPLDKVYSVLGLVADRFRIVLTPDYNRSASWAYAMVIKAHVSCYGDLEIMSLIDDGSKNTSCPSWAVDLDREKEMKHFSPELRLFNACAGVEGIVSFSEDLESMYVDGFCIDVVDDDSVQGDRDVFKWNESSRRWNWEVDLLVQKLRDSGGLQNPYGSKAMVPSERTRQGIEGALYDVAIAGQQYNWTTSKYQQTSFVYPESNASTGEAPPPRPVDWEQISKEASAWTVGRTIILTQKRHLGLAPSSTRTGDHIFILLGFWMPVVLSPRLDGSWTFVGSAYLPGKMGGEAVAGLESGIYTKTKIELR